jgi:hypothetical protein
MTNGDLGRSVRLKTVQLGMITVAACSALENFLSQEPLPPDGEKASRIEIARVE